LIAGTYLAGTNTRRVRRALFALFGGAVARLKIRSNVEAVCGRSPSAAFDAELEARDFDARRAALDAEAKAIATETGES
jgi:hypothetical protein